MPKNTDDSLSFTDTPKGRIIWDEVPINETAIRLYATIYNDDDTVKQRMCLLHEAENAELVRKNLIKFLSEGGGVNFRGEIPKPTFKSDGSTDS